MKVLVLFIVGVVIGYFLNKWFFYLNDKWYENKIRKKIKNKK
jgi:uncharacterized membrane protein YciS (DUF1049 family)